jgi:hypothetical protein
LIVVAMLTVPLAQAGLYEDLFQGLDLLATPSGSPIIGTADGTRVNGNRSGRLRIVPDRVGRGHTLEFDRTFGADSRGRPEILDLGLIQLQLNGATSVTLGYTGRGFFIGNADIFANNLGYAWRLKSGLQNVEGTGTVNLQQQIEVNQFGFYNALIRLSNSDSQIRIDGVLVTADDLDTSFDVGPINISGNVFFDAALALMTSFGLDTTALEGIFPKSPIDRINDAIQEQLYQQTGGVVAGVSALAGELTDSSSYVVTIDGNDLLGAGYGIGPAVQSPGDGSPAHLPEPGTLLLVGLGAAVTLMRRR